MLVLGLSQTLCMISEYILAHQGKNSKMETISNETRFKKEILNYKENENEDTRSDNTNHCQISLSLKITAAKSKTRRKWGPPLNENNDEYI